MTNRANLADDLITALNPKLLMEACNLTPEAWQKNVLRTRPQRGLLCCCRQAGQSLTAAVASLHEALYLPGSLVLLLAPSQRQSSELLRTTRTLLSTPSDPGALSAETLQALEFSNGSRIISLPAREDTIRGFSNVALIAIDEAAWVDDDLYMAARPMLAVSGGRLLALSTPNGQRGWFHREWTGPEPWQRVKITAAECPRIAPSFLAEERRSMTTSLYASEYECEFTDAIDSVFRTEDVSAALHNTLIPLFPEGW